MCRQSNLLSRNIISYESDVQLNNVSETSVWEKCIFQQIRLFNVTENFIFIFTYSIPEGVAYYDIALIISGLIEQGCFTLFELNN